MPANGLGVVRRALFWSMLAWLPVVAWAWATGRATGAGEPLLAHFGTHARFLVAVPLLVLAEGYAHALTSRLAAQIERCAIVPDAERPRFLALRARIARMRDATLPWVAILAVVIAAATLPAITDRMHEVDWDVDGSGTGRRLGFGAWWLLLVGRPIFLTLLLAWLWRAVLLLMLMRGLARLDLALVPTHPDRQGGIAFLARLPVMFAPVVLAIAVVLAAAWAHDAVYHQVRVTSLRVEMAAFTVVVLALFLAPMLPLSRPLARAKKQGLLDYGALVGRHGRLVHERWIEGRTVGDDAVLSAPELGPVADTAALYQSVERMRPLPFGKATVLPLVLAALVPMIAVLAIEIPVKDLLSRLIKALL